MPTFKASTDSWNNRKFRFLITLPLILAFPPPSHSSFIIFYLEEKTKYKQTEIWQNYKYQSFQRWIRFSLQDRIDANDAGSMDRPIWDAVQRDIGWGSFTVSAEARVTEQRATSCTQRPPMENNKNKIIKMNVFKKKRRRRQNDFFCLFVGHKRRDSLSRSLPHYDK